MLTDPTDRGVSKAVGSWCMCLLNRQFVVYPFKSTTCVFRTRLAQSYAQTCPVFSGTNNRFMSKPLRCCCRGCLLNGQFVEDLCKSITCMHRTRLAHSYAQACPVFPWTNLLAVIKRLEAHEAVESNAHFLWITRVLDPFPSLIRESAC